MTQHKKIAPPACIYVKSQYSLISTSNTLDTPGMLPTLYIKRNASVKLETSH